ncbi:MAG: carbohydrate kinase family protein [Clostridiales bacterium]|jgi:sugar/nucleoside kinase (ribokinase family)|nr:carbohydrate kinase family protein [Clostridiales bacterium]
MRTGITVAGNIFADHIRYIEKYPLKGTLSNIRGEELCVGGCVSNTAICLKKLDAKLKVSAVGRIGNDAEKKFLLERLRFYGVETKDIITDANAKTGYTDVYSELGSGDRTFFNYRGANAFFRAGDFDFSESGCRIFHLGYALLLDSLDAPHPELGTNMAFMLKIAWENGIKTSLDAASENKSRYKDCIIPPLKYTNYAIMYEIESGITFSIPARDTDGRLNLKNLRRICEAFLSAGAQGLCCDSRTGSRLHSGRRRPLYEPAVARHPRGLYQRDRRRGAGGHIKGRFMRRRQPFSRGFDKRNEGIRRSNAA